MGLDVDWKFAKKVSSQVASNQPFAEQADIDKMKLDLRELTARAETLVEIETGLVSNAGPARARTTDRMGWVDANLASFERLLRPLFDRSNENGEVSKPGSSLSESDFVKDMGPAGQVLGSAINFSADLFGSASKTVGPKIAGAEVGALLGWMSRRVLGQYDLLVIEEENPEKQDLVYYVGPNIMALEIEHRFAEREFRLWIAIHECTHRAQFTGVEWLRPHFLSLVHDLLGSIEPDPKKLFDTMREMRSGSGDESVRDAIKDRGLGGLFAQPAQREKLDKLAGLMSLLEGHGDIVMDRAAKELIPSQAHFSKVLSDRRKNASSFTKLLQRLVGIEAKLAQYEQGESFVKAVEASGGRELFDQVWVGPENLPTIEEVRDPKLWIDRITSST